MDSDFGTDFARQFRRPTFQYAWRSRRNHHSASRRTFCPCAKLESGRACRRIKTSHETELPKQTENRRSEHFLGPVVINVRQTIVLVLLVCMLGGFGALFVVRQRTTHQAPAPNQVAALPSASA